MKIYMNKIFAPFRLKQASSSNYFNLASLFRLCWCHSKGLKNAATLWWKNQCTVNFW